MYNVHPYFSLKILGKKMCIIHGKIWYISYLVPVHLWPLTSYSEYPLLASPNLLMMKCEINSPGLGP